MHNPNRRTTIRRASLAMAVTLAAPILVHVTAANPAAAVHPLALYRVQHDDLGGSPTFKELRVRCGRGPRGEGDFVIGGGARIVGGNGEVRLTRLEPAVFSFPNDYGFIARAEEPEGGNPNIWSLSAFVICTTRVNLPGYNLFPINRTTAETSSTFKHIDAPCPDGSRVVGTGARVNHANGQVGLQLSRPDGPLGIARATAREDADGYAQTWSLTSIAVCADRIESAAVTGTIGDIGGFFDCPPGKGVHSVGGGGGLTDSGPFFLDTLWAADDLIGFSVFMTGVPTSRTAIGAICAN